MRSVIESVRNQEVRCLELCRFWQGCRECICRVDILGVSHVLERNEKLNEVDAKILLSSDMMGGRGHSKVLPRISLAVCCF